MPKRFDLRDLHAPLIAAPMAGGPSTPELAAAATNAGGLGFVAAGYLTAEVFAQRLAAARTQTSGPLGVNLFVPQPSAGTRAEVESYAGALADEVEHYGVRLGEPRYDDDDWSAKLDVVLDLRPEVVSFTFGLPTVGACRRLRDAGITTVGTVTTLHEAQSAEALGVDALVAQGPWAGGHRGTFDPAAQPSAEPLDELLAAIVVRDNLPVVAAGGLATADDVERVLRRGAVAAQLGTVFLLADEAGTNPAHRAALQDAGFTETVVTRAFTGRYARGLRNRFIDRHEAEAPFGYPELHYLTSPLRAASIRSGDPHGTNLWAGTGFREARAASVAAIMKGLV
jgi:nitronate monooxygenase